MKCHTPGLALHTTVAGKCPRSPEDEQEKQGESMDSRGSRVDMAINSWRVRVSDSKPTSTEDLPFKRAVKSIETQSPSVGVCGSLERGDRSGVVPVS
ncbi:hypothetical protein TNCV_2112161 [Trichonephila clavipes]|nr:hypothetical protein TNCV_2112161 [Trichonephila clavipes]